MSMYLFIANGLLEGAFAVSIWRNPGMLLPENTGADKGAQIYCGILGPMMGSMCISSILMAKQPENKSKHTFAFGWLIYHLTVGIRTIKASLSGEKNSYPPAIFHTTFAILFIMYLRSVQFKVTQILPLKQ